jgi:hypothetical protein
MMTGTTDLRSFLDEMKVDINQQEPAQQRQRAQTQASLEEIIASHAAIHQAAAAASVEMDPVRLQLLAVSQVLAQLADTDALHSQRMHNQQKLLITLADALLLRIELLENPPSQHGVAQA